MKNRARFIFWHFVQMLYPIMLIIATLVFAATTVAGIFLSPVLAIIYILTGKNIAKVVPKIADILTTEWDTDRSIVMKYIDQKINEIKQKI